MTLADWHKAQSEIHFWRNVEIPNHQYSFWSKCSILITNWYWSSSRIYIWFLKQRCPWSNFQSSFVVCGNQGALFSSFMAAKALVTIGSIAEDQEIFWTRFRSSCWTCSWWTSSLRSIVTMWLSSVMFTSSFRDRALVGLILTPHSTPHIRS